MNNQTLREIEMRLAYQMNSADSSNLIDSPAASKLGGHRALLYLRETGVSKNFGRMRFRRPTGWLGSPPVSKKN